MRLLQGPPINVLTVSNENYISKLNNIKYTFHIHEDGVSFVE